MNANWFSAVSVERSKGQCPAESAWLCSNNNTVLSCVTCHVQISKKMFMTVTGRSRMKYTCLASRWLLLVLRPYFGPDVCTIYSGRMQHVRHEPNSRLSHVWCSACRKAVVESILFVLCFKFVHRRSDCADRKPWLIGSSLR